ncbi:MAG: tRNA uridine-5-carboxymethylaminomethyl(34) synthesis GTPase MnmE [Gammaproteobacteria bacterium]
MATPPGRGAISIARLSGRGIPALCVALTGALPRPRQAALCDFRAHDGRAIDRGLALYFPAPHSYTGEHALELHAHGSPVVMNMLVRRCLELGARLARPGEFSERAFMNGRLDLAQAEAVADLIASSTEAAARSAMHSLQGEFSARIRELVGELTELRVLVEAEIDFPEEEIEGVGDAGMVDAKGVDEKEPDARMAARLRGLQQRFTQLRDEAARGRLLRDGLKVALTGPPNAGKSSLLNALARSPRAIVSSIPGTTRDLLEQLIEIDGLPVELTDTAGQRDGGDEIEIEGMRRAREAERRADLVLLVVDDAAESPATLPDACGGAPVCLVRNKIDLSGRAPGASGSGVALSALSGAGLDALREMIKTRAGHRDSEDNPFIARARHLDALQRARARLDAGARELAAARGELLAEELGACQRILGEITGEVGSDDLLGMIFASFCIGK